MVLFKIFKDSFKELKSINCITITGILIAFYIITENFFSVELLILKINFAFIALAAIGMLYGPAVSVLAAIPCDIIGALSKGHSLIFVFTLIAMFEGLIYGLFLYRYDIRNKKSIANNARIIAAQSIVILISHLIFNTAALYFLGFLNSSESLLSLIYLRAVKNLIELPIDIALMFVVLVPVKMAHKKLMSVTLNP